MKTLSIVIVASAGLALSGCARSATTSANRSAGPQNSTPTAPSGPVTVSPAAHGVIGAGTVLMIRALEPISIRDEAGKTYPAEVANDVIDQGANMLVPKGSGAQLTLLASGDLNDASNRQLAVLSLTVNGKTYQVSAAPATAGEAASANATTGATREAAAILGPVRATGGDEKKTELNIPAKTVLTFRLDQSIQLKGYTP